MHSTEDFKKWEILIEKISGKKNINIFTIIISVVLQPPSSFDQIEVLSQYTADGNYNPIRLMVYDNKNGV